MLLLALATPLVLLGMLLGMHAVERRLEADVATGLTREDDVVTLAVLMLPEQRDGEESDDLDEDVGVDRSLSA